MEHPSAPKTPGLSRMREESRGKRVILVTGGAGYIGSLLVRRLLRRGYHVRVLDSLLYGGMPLQDLRESRDFTLIRADLRHGSSVAEAVRGVDAVIHLGAIVGDAACAINENLTLDTNLHSVRALAELCKSYGVPRLLFASSCSVYGASENVLDETSALMPLSLYAETKILAERMLLSLADERFAPVLFRFATAYGYSHRPRFDLVINLLTAKAHSDRQITIFGGNQWRPFVHADDIGRALIVTLEAPLQKVAGQVFNVGTNSQNYQLIKVGKLIKEVIPSAELTVDSRITDKRNYYVRFDKFRTVVGFRAVHGMRRSIVELASALDHGAMGTYLDSRYDNSKYLSAALSEKNADLKHVLKEPAVMVSEELSKSIA